MADTSIAFWLPFWQIHHAELNGFGLAWRYGLGESREMRKTIEDFEEF
ncbi:MAG: hypothetical protein AAGA40_05985 [Cyanobacteria bacterium P01_E01_bin.45]